MIFILISYRMTEREIRVLAYNPAFNLYYGLITFELPYGINLKCFNSNLLVVALLLNFCVFSNVNNGSSFYLQ